MYKTVLKVKLMEQQNSTTFNKDVYLGIFYGYISTFHTTHCVGIQRERKNTEGV